MALVCIPSSAALMKRFKDLQTVRPSFVQSDVRMSHFAIVTLWHTSLVSSRYILYDLFVLKRSKSRTHKDRAPRGRRGERHDVADPCTNDDRAPRAKRADRKDSFVNLVSSVM